MNKFFITFCMLLTAVFVIAGCEKTPEGPPKDDTVKSMTLGIEYITEIQTPPKKKDVSIWIPIPKTDTWQEISDFKADSRFPYMINEDAAGNRMLYIKTDDIKRGDRITLSYTVTRKAVTAREDINIKPEDHQTPTEWEEWDEDVVEYIKTAAGDENDPVKRGRKVYDYIIDTFEYIHDICGRGVSAIALEEETGRCDEYSAIFRTMMMYKGIPVRWEQGMMLPYPSEIQESGEFLADCFNARSWVSFQTGDGRWMPADPAEGKRRPALRDYYYGKLVPNVIKFSTGRSLTLNPPQETIINTFPYTYMEAGGFPSIYGHNYQVVLKYKLIEIQ